MSMQGGEKKKDWGVEWPRVVEGFTRILNAVETGKDTTYKEWMTLYDTVFGLAIAQYEEKIYVELAKIFETFVRGQSKKIFAKEGAELMLREYLKLFNDFTKTSFSVAKICRYLSRYWIPANLTKSVQSIEVREIYPLALVIWRQHCFEPIKDKLIPSLLNLLDSDRKGQKQDKTLIRNMVNSYIEYDKVAAGEGQTFYEKEFESRYLERLKQFYAAESTAFLQSNGVSLYLQRAEERIDEEKKNAEYLGTYITSSDPKIKKAIDEVLIEKHMESLQSDFLNMLREDKFEDMRRLYFLLSRVPNGLPNTSETFQAYLVDVGTKIINDQKDKDVKEAFTNAIPFVKKLMQFYEKYFGLVATCFSSNNLFKSALDKAFRDIMNQNTGKFNMPRLLNTYLDNLIRGKEKDVSTEDQIDEVLQRLVNLFTYLQDKDEFFEYFRKQLSKRLLSKTKQYNENSEKSFLSKLKAQSGDAAIRKLQGMFTDVQDESLNDMNQRFQDYNSSSNKVNGLELEVQVLNDSHWPISGTQKFPMLLSKELKQAQDKFQEFYDSKTEKRKLTWLYNYGVVTLNARFTNSKLPIQLVLTPLQASILIQFNQGTKLSFNDLLVALWPQVAASKQVGDMSLEEILRYAIQPLVYYKYKVLAKESDPDPKKEAINNSDVFMLRDKIPAKKLPRKIPFPTVSAKQQKQEADDDRQLVLKQREFEIDAAMVRVMKSRNRLEWNKLSVEVVELLKSRFTPDPKILKKRLESLIERKFMDRDENDPKMIYYIS